MVPNTISLNDLHEIIQEVMGWKNYHLWEFRIRNNTITLDEEGYNLAEASIDKLARSAEFRKMIKEMDLSKGFASLDVDKVNKILEKLKNEEKQNLFNIETPISKVINKEKIKFNYRYDFGDDWKHTLIVEKIFNRNIQEFPICLEGERACPLEDCGGVSGYKRFIEILKTGKDPQGENANELKKWLGRWDPEKFDLNKINKKLARWKN